MITKVHLPLDPAHARARKRETTTQRLRGRGGSRCSEKEPTTPEML